MKIKAVSIVAIFVLTLFAGLISLEADIVSAGAGHSTILIVGNGNFTLANGVTSGNGTEGNPFIIEDWEINASQNRGIEIRNTDAYFLVRNVSVHSGANNSYDGIYLHNVSNGRFIDCNLSENYNGISLINSSGVFIENNSFYLNDDSGVILSNSVFNEISHNDFIDNFKYAIILISSSNGNRVTTNNFTSDHKWGIRLLQSHYNLLENNRVIPINENELGIDLEGSSHNEIINNNISFYDYGIMLRNNNFNPSTNNNISGNLVTVCSYAGIQLDDSLDNNITDNLIFDNFRGIILRGGNNNLIENNSIHDVYYGIRLWLESDNNTIINNNIWNTTRYAIDISSSSKNDLINNVLNYNKDDGVQLDSESNNNRILKNKITNNTGYGIILSSSDNNKIENNQIDSNGGTGIILTSESDNNDVLNNKITRNGNGIYSMSSSNNDIINNSIKLNSNGIYCNGVLSDFNIIGNTIVDNSGGIRLDEAYYFNILNNNISNLYQGISLSSSSRNIIENNYIFSELEEAVRIRYSSSILNLVKNNNMYSNQSNGLYISDSVSNNITGNTICGNEAAIYLSRAHYNTFTQNRMLNSGIMIKAYPNMPGEWTSNYFDTTNTVNGKPVYFWSNRNGGTIDSDAGQVILADSENIIVKDVNISNGFGITLAFSSWNTIINCTIDSNPNDGIYLTYSDNNSIIENTVSSNLNEGIELYYSDNNIITNNTANFNEFGIYIRDGYDNTIVENTIANNNNGIYLGSTSGNTIYHNNFIDNINNTYLAFTTNTWDNGYPSGGNYWSDLSGYDLYNGIDPFKWGRDGIFDSALILDDTNQDNFPLAKPYGDMPSAPQNLSVDTGEMFIRLSWDEPLIEGTFPVAEYIIYRSTSSQVETYYTTIKNELYFNDTSATPGIMYYYRISASHVVGEGERSKEISGMCGELPEKPGELQVSAVINHINLSWNLSVFNGIIPIDNFNIYRGTEPGAQLLLVQVGNVSFYRDYDVSVGVTYYYRISAVNYFGEGPLSDEFAGVIPKPPSAPLDLNVNAGSSFVNLSWSQPIDEGTSSITFYNIYRKTAVSDFMILDAVPGDRFFYNDTSVNNDETYTYKLSAESIDGKGPFSNEISATPKLDVIINLSPTALLQANNTAGSAPLYVHFNGSGIDPDGYIVSYYWDFGDGTNSTEREQLHVYSQAGTFYVELTVTDDRGQSSLAMVTITVIPSDVPGEQSDETVKSSDEDSKWSSYATFTAGAGIVLILLLLLAFPQVLRKSIPKAKGRILRNISVVRKYKVLKQSQDEQISTAEITDPVIAGLLEEPSEPVDGEEAVDAEAVDEIYDAEIVDVMGEEPEPEISDQNQDSVN
jgi:parallel beta-helix repeat protein